MVLAEKMEMYALIERLIDRVLKLEAKFEEESTYNTQRVKELVEKLEYRQYVPYEETSAKSPIDQLKEKLEVQVEEKDDSKETVETTES